VPISASQHAHVFAHGLGCTRSAPRGIALPKDVGRREANDVYSERLWAQRQRRREWSVAQVVKRARGEDTPSEPEFSGGDDEEEDEDGDEGEVTPLPHYPPSEDLPSLSDIFSQQAEIFIGAGRPKWS
jgi:hypothetical protein